MPIPALALAAMISGGATVASGAIGASTARSAARRSSQEAALDRQFQAQQAEIDRAFQRNMSNTAYRRAARDLEKAGLNRILALGSPASTPSGRGVSGSSAAGPVGAALSAAGQIQASAGAQASQSVGTIVQAMSQAKLNDAKTADILAGIDFQHLKGELGRRGVDGIRAIIEGLISTPSTYEKLQSFLEERLKDLSADIGDNAEVIEREMIKFFEKIDPTWDSQKYYNWRDGGAEGVR